jgi:surface polysaccharide O-acyltransferase-like enzyme
MGDSRGQGKAGADAYTSLAVANLRGVFIVILVSFHSCLAYLGSTTGPAVSFDQPPFLWLAFPIVDDRRFFGFDLYCTWEDMHIMALMFFVSGLFVAPSLQRKGALRFAADRLLRLGLPFLFNVLVLMPIAIWPVFHRLSPEAGLSAYLGAYLALPFLPNGPTWFLWLLLAFSCLAALLYAISPDAIGRLGAMVSDARRKPERFLAGLAIALALAYLPPTLAYNPFDWFERGLFSFQISRPFLYGVYFFAGVAIGAHGIGAGLLAPDGRLRRLWKGLAVGSPLLLFAWLAATSVTLIWPDFAPLAMKIVSALAYVSASVAGVMLWMALSTRFSGKRIAWLEPLSRNSLGIFVIHYTPVVWMQYLMTSAPLPAFLKAAIVFAVALPLSLGLAMAMRRRPVLARLIGEGPSRAPSMAPGTPSRA